MQATSCYIVIIKMPLQIFLITVMMFEKVYITLRKTTVVL